MLDALTKGLIHISRYFRRCMLVPTLAVTMFVKRWRIKQCTRVFEQDDVAIGEHICDTDGAIILISGFWLLAFTTQILPWFTTGALTVCKVVSIITLCMILFTVCVNGWSNILCPLECTFDPAVMRTGDDRGLIVKFMSIWVFLMSIPALIVYIIVSCLIPDGGRGIRNIDDSLNWAVLSRCIIITLIQIVCAVTGLVAMTNPNYRYIGLYLLVTTMSLPYGLMTIVKACNHLDWIDDTALSLDD